MNLPSSLSRSISPPPRSPKWRKSSKSIRRQAEHHDATIHFQVTTTPTLAAVEAGKAKVEDYIAYFKEQLSRFCREREDGQPRIDIEDWVSLYQRNEHEHGNHFVIHQHNHPVSGVHYDLRLQFSKTSSVSFALPKGLPGNPNSKSLGRMAIETRVHNLWNHLIESASHKTGSLLIWDTGTYEVLPRKAQQRNPPSPQTTDDESDSEMVEPGRPPYAQTNVVFENERLIHAFRTKYIRLRLHGTCLPPNYTVTLRLPSTNDFDKLNSKPRFSRKRRAKLRVAQSELRSSSTDLDEEPTPPPQQMENVEDDIDTDDEEDLQTRTNNAYPGSTNSIGSVHQRRWFMLLDRASSGFVLDKGSGRWVRRGAREGEGFEPFFVRGREIERSVVTGRLAMEVESDEGVEGFVGRSGWVGITG